MSSVPTRCSQGALVHCSPLQNRRSSAADAIHARYCASPAAKVSQTGVRPTSTRMITPRRLHRAPAAQTSKLRPAAGARTKARARRTPVTLSAGSTQQPTHLQVEADRGRKHQARARKAREPPQVHVAVIEAVPAGHIAGQHPAARSALRVLRDARWGRVADQRRQAALRRSGN